LNIILVNFLNKIKRIFTFESSKQQVNSTRCIDGAL